MLFRVLSRAVIAITITLTLPGAIVVADEATDVDLFLLDEYSIWLGGFFPNLDSRIRLDPGIGSPGDDIDFEDTLGLDDSKSVGFGGFRWRMSPRHMLEFELIQLNRRGLVVGISEDLNIGDYEVRIGSQIDTVFDVTLGRMTYGYNVISSDKTALNLKAGLHIASLDTVLKLSGAVFKDGIPIGDPATVVEEGGGINAPLPHFGASYAHAFSPELAIRAQALLFAIKINDYKGTLVDFGVDLQYWPWQHFGLGAGLRYFRTTVEDNSDSGLRGKFVYEYVGPVVYGTWGF
jgi:hypothetical protein